MTFSPKSVVSEVRQPIGKPLAAKRGSDRSRGREGAVCPECGGVFQKRCTKWLVARITMLAAIAAAAISLAACAAQTTRPEPSQFTSIADAEAVYGPLVSAANHPTPNQNGNGERMGLFRDAAGTVWGLPLSITSDSEVLACAPPALVHAGVTDTFAAASSVVGATNSPTGWRGGTGDLELLLRDAHGKIYRQAVHGADLPPGVVCANPERQGPQRRLHYYRLAPSGDR